MKTRGGAKTSKTVPKTTPLWGVEFFQRHHKDDPSRAVPGRDFLDTLPDKVVAHIRAVLEVVAKAPPPAFSGGGYWTVMHGQMAGFYEVRIKGKDKMLHRLFCLLERNGDKVGLDGPSIIIIDGRSKPEGTAIPTKEYGKVQTLGNEFLNRQPRSVLK